jgi:hypothetical protein
MESSINEHHEYDTIHKDNIANINELFTKYKNNDYMLGRLCYYLQLFIPSALENDETNHNQREERKKQLTTDSEEFIQKFLHKNKYYYTPQTERFLLYDGTHFNAFNEDDIYHQILSTITNENTLMVWKRKINITILKRIKERSPLNAIPESNTIQFVINQLYPAIFSTRNSAKYFLTIIGDCIHGKNDNTIIYIISPTIKQFLNEISNQCHLLLGLSNCLNNIKFKYYDHDYEKCRLLQVNTQTIIHTNDKHKSFLIPPGLIKHMLDLLCVSSHYSLRYGSSDGFLKQCSETKLVEHALYLHKNTLETITTQFIDKTLKPCVSSKIENKKLLFLFKKFLDDKGIPNIAFHEQLKLMFKSKLKYNEEEDVYLDITSAHLPFVSSFMKFWETTMSQDLYDEEPELEIDEVSTLFKGWLQKNKNTNSNLTNTNANTNAIVTNTNTNANLNISDNFLLELIHHFFPDVVVEENKYITHIKCNLWNKRIEIVNSLYLFKLKCNDQAELFTRSLYEAYEFYSLNNKHLCLASKKYFEKIAAEIIAVHIDSDGLISPTWWK